MITTESVNSLMRRCQIGVGGPNALARAGRSSGGTAVTDSKSGGQFRARRSLARDPCSRYRRVPGRGTEMMKLTPEQLLDLAARAPLGDLCILRHPEHPDGLHDVARRSVQWALDLVAAVNEAMPEDAERSDGVVAALRAENDRLRGLLNTPELHNFSAAVQLEAAHQREHWGSAHDAGKTPADWFWLVGYLAGKALHAQTSGNTEKALHHTISTAAALANWHAAIAVTNTDMRPRIEPPAEPESDDDPFGEPEAETPEPVYPWAEHPDAQWMAADSNGLVWRYSEEPSMGPDCWNPTGDSGDARMELVRTGAGSSCPHWRETKRRRPEGV